MRMLVCGIACLVLLSLSIVTAVEHDCVEENSVYIGGDLAASSAPATSTNCIYWCAENFPQANLWQYVNPAGICYCKRRLQAQAVAPNEDTKSGSLSPALVASGCPAAISRDEWDAEQAPPADTVQTPSIVVLHQSANCNEQLNPTACVGAIIKSIQTKHIDAGLIDIGFDYLIDWTGRLYKGSETVMNPGIVKDYPGQTLNIAMIGQFNHKSAPAPAMAALRSTLDCLVDDGVIDSNYVIHADWTLPICGEQLYTDLTTSTSLTQYTSELTAAEKAVYDVTLRDVELERIMNETTAVFCEMYKDDPEVRGKPPCTDDCPACLPHEEVAYILDYLNNPEGARDYYLKRGRHYAEHDYSRTGIKRYIKFHMDRLLHYLPDLFLTAWSKIYQYKYAVMLSAM